MITLIVGTGCEVPPAIYQASIVEYISPGIVIYKCSIGFMFSAGSNRRTSWCQQDLTWSLEDTECIGTWVA